MALQALGALIPRFLLTAHCCLEMTEDEGEDGSGSRDKFPSELVIPRAVLCVWFQPLLCEAQEHPPHLSDPALLTHFCANPSMLWLWEMKRWKNPVAVDCSSDSEVAAGSHCWNLL